MSTIDDTSIAFGRYRGMTPKQIAESDPSYVVWMYDNVMPKPCSKRLRDDCESDDRDDEAESELDAT